jgi:hypothetical protein
MCKQFVSTSFQAQRKYFSLTVVWHPPWNSSGVNVGETIRIGALLPLSSCATHFYLMNSAQNFQPNLHRLHSLLRRAIGLSVMAIGIGFIYGALQSSR